MKHVRIRIIGSKHPPVQLQIQEGTRSCDVLAHLKWDKDYVLALASTPHRSFAEGDDVHALVTDGAKLIAMTSVQAADAFMEYIAFGEGEI